MALTFSGRLKQTQGGFRVRGLLELAQAILTLIWNTLGGNLGVVAAGQGFTETLSAAVIDGDAEPVTANITYTLVSGTLPTGLSLNPDGSFSGVLANELGEQDFTFTVRASAPGVAPVDRVFSITAAADPEWITPENATLAEINLDQEFETTILASSPRDLEFELVGDAPETLEVTGA
jgi:hypothetical protein